MSYGLRCSYFGIFKDGSGRIVPSGSVTVYLSGTSTLANIYTTVSGTTAVNTVTANSVNGSFEFWIDRFDYDSSQKFKTVLSKSGYTSQNIENLNIDSVVLGTYTISDDLTVTTNIYAPSGVIWSVASGKTLTFSGVFDGSHTQHFTGDVTFGTGSVKEVYSEWWGAKADNSTLNTTALQCALTAIGTASGQTPSPKLKLLHGIYKTGALSRNANNITIDGVSMFSSVLDFGVTPNYCLILGTTAGRQNIWVKNLKIRGDITVATQNLLGLLNATLSGIEAVTFENSGKTGLVLEGSNTILVEKSVFSANVAHDIIITKSDDSTANAIEIRKNTFTGTNSEALRLGVAEAVKHGSGLWIHNNVFEMGALGAKEVIKSYSRWDNIKIDGNYFENTAGAGGADIYLKDQTINGLTIEDNKVLSGTDYFADIANANGVRIRGNKSFAHNNAMIRIHNSVTRLLLGPNYCEAGTKYEISTAKYILMDDEAISIKSHIDFPYSEVKRFTVAIQTTDATDTVIYTLPLSDNTTYSVLHLAVANRTGITDPAGYYRHTVASRIGAGVAVLLGQTAISVLENDATFHTYADVNGNNLRIRVQGAVGKTVNWVVEITVICVGAAL